MRVVWDEEENGKSLEFFLQFFKQKERKKIFYERERVKMSVYFPFFNPSSTQLTPFQCTFITKGKGSEFELRRKYPK
jgi:hypothetical protein